MSPSRAIALAAIVAAGNPCGTALEGDRDADALQERGMKALDAHRDDDAATALRAAFDRHVALGDQAGASIDARLLSRAHRALSRYTDALRWAETARVRAVESGDEALLGRALAWLGDLFQIIGDDERAIEIGAEAALHLPDSDRVERATMKIYRARYLDSLGQSAEPAALLEEARDLGAQAGRLGVVRSACINLAGLALHDGRLDDAERHLRDARAAWRADPAAPPPRAILVNEALLARERGDLAASARAARA
ncbi:MAG TPA: hypothetical protein VEL05_00520, partial [Candidatus Acidoferrum sp.]|nr:hypothetical protein [Candidatus Acidoferrum sp.]